MIYYIMDDDLVVFHRFELGETEMIAANQKYSVVDEATVNQMIADGEDVTMPEFDEEYVI